MYDLNPATRALAGLVAAVDDAQLGAPTPCPDYTVGDLLDHIGGLALAFASAARKENGLNASQPPPAARARLGDEWRTRIPQDLAGMGDAWAEPGAWEGMTTIAGMEMPATVVGTVGLNEVVAHAWDLARATGRPFEPDAKSIEGCLEFLVPMSQPAAADSRAPAFGPVVATADDASALDQMIALNGRNPGWSTRRSSNP